MKNNYFLGLLLGIVLLVLIYNSLFPYTIQESAVTGMGMHGKTQLRTAVYSVPIYSNIILIGVAFLMAFFLINKGFTKPKGNSCKKCRMPIESDQWKICPNCGSHLGQSKGDGN